MILLAATTAIGCARPRKTEVRVVNAVEMLEPEPAESEAADVPPLPPRVEVGFCSVEIRISVQRRAVSFPFARPEWNPLLELESACTTELRGFPREKSPETIAVWYNGFRKTAGEDWTLERPGTVKFASYDVYAADGILTTAHPCE